MPLAPETRLGPYEILGQLGAGGMGEVYRARDTRLGREVALKVLPAEFSGDSGRRARFEQEARAAAALNHPNILGLYDFGSQDGISYIVTELVAGETLAAWIERGPVAIRKLLDVAVQTADGMAAAHAARITHRDLKPANIMVASDGRVKILDFGLAKQSAAASAAPDDTMTVAQTQPGMILGTVSYMSPEQARAKPTDYRSDQFSFGLILYEMATGKKAFDRPEPVQTMSAMLTEEPAPIERTIPGPLRWVIDRCLAKDPAERYESSRDLFQELRALRDHLSDASTTQAAAVAAVGTVAAPSARRVARWPVPAAFALGLLAAFAALLLLAGPQIPDQSTFRFTPFSFEPGGQRAPVWSPDGKAVAYAARGEAGPFQVYVRYLDSPTPVQITHSAESAYPDGWLPDGKRILIDIDREPHGLWSVATVGGEPEPFLANDYHARASDISPDTKTVALLKRGDDDRYGVWLSSPPGAPLKQYTPQPFATREVFNRPYMRFSPDGKRILLFLNGDRKREEVWLMPYPPNPSQPPHQVLADLPSFGGTPTFSWMPDSRRIAISLVTSPEAEPQLWIADTSSGERHALTSGTTGRVEPAVSPDGRKLIFAEGTSNLDVVSVDLSTATPHALIATRRNESMPSWAAKKPVLVYVTNRNGPQEIWLHTEGNPERPLVTARDFPPDTTQWLMGPALSPEGDRVIYTRSELHGGGTHAWISAVAGGAPVPLTNDTASTEFPGSWSFDGNWFAYLAFKDGKVNLMKVKTSGQATPAPIREGLTEGYNGPPTWSPIDDSLVWGDNLYSSDGKTVRPLGNHHPKAYTFSLDGKLLYGMRGDKERELLFSVDVAGGAEKVIGDVGKAFRYASFLSPATRYSLAPDGKSVTYGAGRSEDDLWLLEGFAEKTGVLARLGLR